MKTSELSGALLDQWVARALGLRVELRKHSLVPVPVMVLVEGNGGSIRGVPQYSTDWAQGGPIIEREHIVTTPPQCIGDWDQWRAFSRGDVGGETGDTLLIAAMRAFVVSKYGDEVQS